MASNVRRGERVSGRQPGRIIAGTTERRYEKGDRVFVRGARPAPAWRCHQPLCRLEPVQGRVHGEYRRTEPEGGGGVAAGPTPGRGGVLKPQNILPPGGTSRSGKRSTTSPASSGTPRTSTSLLKPAIRLGGKLTTATTCFPTRPSGS